MRRTTEELFKTPRMNFAELSDNNCVEGLYHLVKEIDTSNFTIVEVGSYAGVSSELLAKNCKKLYCVDVWMLGSKGFNNEQLDYAATEFKKVMNGYDNIIAVNDFSLEAATFIPDESIDMVYIDAVHDYEDVLADIIAWSPKVKKGGYICGHDIHMEGVERAVKETFGKDYKTYKDTSWMHKK